MRDRLMRLAAAGMLTVLALPVRGQVGPVGGPEQPPAEAFKETSPYDNPERKESSWWHMPAAANAQEQLARARRFESEGARSRAIKAYDALVHEWYSAPESLVAQAALARLCEEAGEYERAFEEYQYLIAFFSGQFDYLQVLDRQYRCANALRTANRRFLGLPLSSLKTVRQMYARILANGPHWERASEIALAIGRLREDDGDLEEAVAAFEQVMNRYPGTEPAREAAYRAASCRYQIAHRQPRDAQSRRYAIAALSAFLQAYPLDARGDELRLYRREVEDADRNASYEQAVFYDRNRHDRTAAVAAYRDFVRRYPDAPQAKVASARLDKLERQAAAANAEETP